MARPALSVASPSRVVNSNKLLGAAARAWTPIVCSRSSGSTTGRGRWSRTDREEAARSWPSGTGPSATHATSPLVSRRSASRSCPLWSSSKYTSSPPDKATTHCRWFARLGHGLAPGRAPLVRAPVRRDVPDPAGVHLEQRVARTEAEIVRTGPKTRCRSPPPPSHRPPKPTSRPRRTPRCTRGRRRSRASSP